MKKIVTVLFIALLGILAACAPSTERVLGENSTTYLLERGLFDRQAEFIIKDADSDLNVYRVEPPVVSLRDTLVIKDVQGPTLGRIIRKSLVLVPTYEIYRDGEQVASLGTELGDVISNALVGNVFGQPLHDYDDRRLAQLRSSWQRVRAGLRHLPPGRARRTRLESAPVAHLLCRGSPRTGRRAALRNSHRAERTYGKPTGKPVEL